MPGIVVTLCTGLCKHFFLHKHNNSDNLCLKMKNFYIYVYYLKLIHWQNYISLMTLRSGWVLTTHPHVLNSVVVSMLDCVIRKGWSSNSQEGRNVVRDVCSTCTPNQLSYDEYTDRTLLVGRWDGDRERTGYLLSYAEAKKMKLLALNTRGSIWDCSSLHADL